MPRFPRSYVKTIYFHVITQGINKSFIFEHPQDIKNYINIMYNLKEEHDIDILAYCVMNNHVHMLLQTEDIKELSKYMHRINTKYAIYYNKKYNRVGYVFRDRYKCEGIYSEEHLYNCIKYIYNNPVKAGICDKPEEYPYSNYRKFKMEDNDDNGYIYLDVEEDDEEICKRVINEFLLENNMNCKELENDYKNLRQLLIVLKDGYDISLRKIAKELKMGREKLRNIYKY